MKGINISQPIVNNAVDENYDALPNIDAIYGPYPNLNAAITAIMASKRAKGLTVGIMTDTGIEEYWFKNGITNGHLVPKNQGGSGGGHNLFVTNNVTKDTNANLQALFPTAQVKDVIVDATLGGVYICYQANKWVKLNGKILTNTASAVTEIREVRMLSMK